MSENLLARPDEGLQPDPLSGNKIYVVHLMSRGRLWLMLVAYIDESGHSADPRCRFVGLGGLVAPVEKWDCFEVSWQALLDEFIDGKPFHMKEFTLVPGQKLYEGWDEPKRRDFLSRLVKVIADTEAVPTGCVVSLDDYEDFSDEVQKLFADPYFMAFQDCTKGAALQALKYEDEKVAMVYARQAEFGAIQSEGAYVPERAGRAEQLWHLMREQTLYGQWMGTYSSSSPKNSIPLQAADLFAYELVKEFENRVRRPNDRMRWALRQILPLGGHMPLLKFYNTETILQLLMDMGIWRPDKQIGDSLSVNASLKKIAQSHLMNSRVRNV